MPLHIFHITWQYTFWTALYILPRILTILAFLYHSVNKDKRINENLLMPKI